jgi:uncharacterized membrane protein YhaH (DUF805 family)
MSLATYLFSFRGRVNRVGFWRWNILGIVWSAAVMLATTLTITAGGPGGLVFLLILPAVVPSLAVPVKRLHDRGKSSRWLLAFVVAPWVLLGVTYGLMENAEGSAPLAASVTLLMALVLTAWGWIEMGFRRGTPGANRYGARP